MKHPPEKFFARFWVPKSGAWVDRQRWSKNSRQKLTFEHYLYFSTSDLEKICQIGDGGGMVKWNGA